MTILRGESSLLIKIVVQIYYCVISDVLYCGGTSALFGPPPRLKTSYAPTCLAQMLYRLVDILSVPLLTRFKILFVLGQTAGAMCATTSKVA